MKVAARSSTRIEFGRWVRSCLVIVVAAGLVPCFGLEEKSALDASFQATVDLLKTRSFGEKAEAARAIAAHTHPRTLEVLTALLDAELYTERKTDRVVFANGLDGGGFNIRDAVTGEGLGQVGRRGAKKISVNNRLRGLLRGLIAGIRLDDKDPDDRIAAAEAIADGADSSMREVLDARLLVESDAKVIAAIETALVVFDLDANDETIRLRAIRASASNLDGRVREKLTGISNDPVASEAIQEAARETLESIEETVARYKTIETVFFGLSLGSVLVLAAIGLSITFGVMGVINMAHGELIMLGAYTTYVVQTLFPGALEYSLLIAVPAAFFVSGLVGIGIERGIFRFLYGRPLETLLASFGVSLVLQQAVKTIFTALNRPVATPQWMSGSFELLDGLSLTFNRLYILIFAGLIFAALVLVLQRTRLGLEVRAVTQNRAMARAMGIRSARVDALTFGLGAGIAGVAGVALSQLTNVGPYLGRGYIVDSFMVVVFGGVGNLWGTLVAGLSLGVANKFLEPYAGAVVAKVLVLVFIILFIQWRPRGLFPQKGRAAES
ncbi:MAG: urea ABC transporter permease subunit UrtB [Pseudomonadales bacterium]|nr:urea ABC transporter permease subunit UrtB [Pseudomonadales bacterium]